MKIVNPKRFGLFLIVLLGGLLLLGWWLWGGSHIRKDGEIEVSQGQRAKSVWQAAVVGGFTKRTIPWQYYSWQLHAAASLKAGTYHVEKGESVAVVIKRMVAGEAISDTLTVTYPEGFTVQQIAARTAATGVGTEDQFVKAARVENFSDTFTWLAALPPTRSLEGYLFPDTYKLSKDDDPVAVIKRQLGNFEMKMTPELRQEATSQGRTLDQIIIMASILEREVVHDSDLPVISGILWKRLDEGMGLDVDATIRYAVNNWDQPLTVQELAIDSPYNTRKYKGLPPGPISNPGLKTILAALRPQKTDYYYYLSTPDGQTVFARTNDEHNANKAKYLQ